MNWLDSACLVIIISSLVIFTLKGFKKILFKLCAISISVIIAKMLGRELGSVFSALGLDAKYIGFSGENAVQVNYYLHTVIGSALLFFALYVILSLVFKFVDGKMNKDVKSGLANRLLGALVGLFTGFAVTCIFVEIVIAIMLTISSVTKDPSILNSLNESIVFRFHRILS